MSSASTSKSKDIRIGKEPVKTSLKPSVTANSGNGIPASAYNPLSGTFHTLEMGPSSSTSPAHTNGRFRNIDETDEHSGVEYDAISNNGSWSGESEEHKDKMPNHPLRQEAIPGADIDKREKTRQKNERKHQRQKEKRAQELHEKCRGYLMSRKLEALAQQLVAMGFTSERATMALILNEGKVEESVAWLLEGGEEDDTGKHSDQKLDAGGNLKIDISEELAQITEMEGRYNCSKQEVERAVVTCEGDLDSAAETLRTQKQEPPATPSKLEGPRSPPNNVDGCLAAVSSQNPLNAQSKSNSSTPIMQRRDEKDFNYTRSTISLGASPESEKKKVQPLRRTLPNFDRVKPPESVVSSEKRGANVGTSPQVSYPLASPLQVSNPLTQTEARFLAVGTESMNFQKPGSLREPVIVMRRNQTVNANLVPAISMASSPPITTPSWHLNGVEIMNNGLAQIPSSRNLSSNQVNLNQLYLHHLQYEQRNQSMSGNGHLDFPINDRGTASLNKTATLPTLAAASSLGLFSGSGTSNSSSESSSPIDWSTGSMMHLDYANIDWSLDRTMPSSIPDCTLWSGVSNFGRKTAPVYDSNNSGMGARTTTRTLSASRNGVSFAGLQNGGIAAQTAPAGFCDWSSPFEGKDLFSLPRQFVYSPSL